MTKCVQRPLLFLIFIALTAMSAIGQTESAVRPTFSGPDAANGNSLNVSDGFRLSGGDGEPHWSQTTSDYGTKYKETNKHKARVFRQDDKTNRMKRLKGCNGQNETLMAKARENFYQRFLHGSR